MDFFRSWHVVDAKCRIFFSPSTYVIYKQMEVMLTRDTGITRQQVDLFREKQLAALTALYAEVGLLAPSLFITVKDWVLRPLKAIRR